MRRLVTGGVVVLGAVLLTTFTIDATDALRGSQSALLFLTRNVTTDNCPDGTVELPLAEGLLCIDAYENSPSEQCPHPQPTSAIISNENLSTTDCQAVSQPGVQPWTYVTYHQAKTLCAQKGMRLPTPNEWYEAALGTPDTAACNSDGRLQSAGAAEHCVSARGAFDMIGNVWEWVEAEVVDGVYVNRTLPPEGYVIAADQAGVAVETAHKPSLLYGEDYFWLRSTGLAAMMRGGYFGSRSDAGVFSIHTNVTPDFASAATGFRCVQTK